MLRRPSLAAVIVGTFVLGFTVVFQYALALVFRSVVGGPVSAWLLQTVGAVVLAVTTTLIVIAIVGPRVMRLQHAPGPDPSDHPRPRHPAWAGHAEQPEPASFSGNIVEGGNLMGEPTTQDHLRELDRRLSARRRAPASA